jgi:hypothetical protein
LIKLAYSAKEKVQPGGILARRLGRNLPGRKISEINPRSRHTQVGKPMPAKG